MNYAMDLPHSTPEEQAISSAALQAFVDAVEQKNLGVQSFILIRNGQVVADGWWHPYASHLPHSMYSVSKSFTATAIGLAISEGLLALDDRLISFFSSYITPEIRDNMGALQIRHLLSMSTGHAKDTIAAMGESPDDNWVRTFLSIPITYQPGTHFLYNNGASFMLSALLQSLSGQSVLEYLETRLFQPLGIEKPLWQSNKSGINIGASGLRLRTIDLAKFGLLYLQRGVWNGQRIVPEEWIAEATKVQVANGDGPNDGPDIDWHQGYGFQFWRCRHNAYRADGAFGQFCLVMPERNAVLALTSGTFETADIINAVWEYLLPGMNAGLLPENSDTAQMLKERLTHLKIPFPKVLNSEPAIAAYIADRTMRFEANILHVSEVSFKFDIDAYICTIRDDRDVQHVIHCGRTDWLLGKVSLWLHEEPLVPLLTAARGGWVDDHTFMMTWQYIETPFHHSITFDFSTNAAEVSMLVDLPIWWQKKNAQLQGQLV